MSHDVRVSIGVMVLRRWSIIVVLGLLMLVVYIDGGDMCGGVVLRLCLRSLACVTLSAMAGFGRRGLQQREIRTVAEDALQFL